MVLANCMDQNHAKQKDLTHGYRKKRDERGIKFSELLTEWRDEWNYRRDQVVWLCERMKYMCVRDGVLAMHMQGKRCEWQREKNCPVKTGLFQQTHHTVLGQALLSLRRSPFQQIVVRAGCMHRH